MKLSRDLTCAEMVELVTRYLEGALPADDRERFEEHIAYCAGCTSYLAQMRDTIRAAGVLREEDLAPELQESLLAAFRDWRSG
jgi:anti-sigma factor RsiW